MNLGTIDKLQVQEPQTTHIYWGRPQIETNLFVQFGEPSNKKKSVRPCKTSYHEKDKKQNKKDGPPRISYISKRIHLLTERRALQQI
jgi:hypothetical protein